MEIMRNFNGENVRISLSAAEVRAAYQEQIRAFNLSAALRAFYKHIGVDEASIDTHAPIDDFVKEDFLDSYGVALDDVLDPSSDYYIIPDIVEYFENNFGNDENSESDWDASVEHVLSLLTPKAPKKDYVVTLKVNGWVRYTVAAENWDDARDKAIKCFEEDDFGNLEDIECEVHNAVTGEDGSWLCLFSGNDDKDEH